MDTLQETLPNFFETGLVALDDRRRGQGPESIYAPNIRLVYTPPSASALPAALPKTIQVEGET